MFAKHVNILAMVLFLVGASQGQAATRLQFLPGNQNAIAIITAASPDGTVDEDWAQLMKMMNVPLQSSPMGPGKSIASQKRDFNLVCGEQRKQCQVFLNRSPRVEIDSVQKKMSFRVTGPEAKEWRRFFYPENEEPVEFVTVDEKFVIQSSETEFVFSAEESM